MHVENLQKTNTLFLKTPSKISSVQKALQQTFTIYSSDYI